MAFQSHDSTKDLLAQQRLAELLVDRRNLDNQAVQLEATRKAFQEFGADARKLHEIEVLRARAAQLATLAGSRLLEGQHLKDTGRVNTFSICYGTWDMKRGKKPFIPAVIEIDGADPGMGILHLIDGVNPDTVEIGMPVRAVWKPEENREGAITDILHFRPTEV